MPDTPLPTNEAPAPEQPTNVEETLETLKTSETVGPDGAEAQRKHLSILRPAPISRPPETPVEQEIEEELIIEDFTIDGICGVY